MLLPISWERAKEARSCKASEYSTDLLESRKARTFVPWATIPSHVDNISLVGARVRKSSSESTTTVPLFATSSGKTFLYFAGSSSLAPAVTARTCVAARATPLRRSQA